MKFKVISEQMAKYKDPKKLVICAHNQKKFGPFQKLAFKTVVKLKNGIVFRFQNGRECVGDYCIYLYAPVTFNPKFLKRINQIFSNSESDFAYCDYRFLNPFSKQNQRNSLLPVWSPERFLHTNYLGPAIAVNRKSLDVSSDLKYENLVEIILQSKLVKLNEFGYVVLAHKYSPDNENHFVSIKKYLASRQPKVKVEINQKNQITINYKNLAPKQISLIVPTRGTKKLESSEVLVCNLARSLRNQKFQYSIVELVVVYDNDVDLSYLEELNKLATNFELKLVEYAPPFNFSKKSNIGANNANGDVLIFLNDDTEFITPTAVIELAGVAMLHNVGAVGAKLYFENHTIQHAGTVVIEGNLGHAYFKQLNPTGSYGDLTAIHEVSAVTGACFAQRKNIWKVSGGWDEVFENSYNDVEYCFRLRELGYSIFQNNQVELFHFESLTRDATFSPESKKLLENQWASYLVNDRYFPQFVSQQIQSRKIRLLVKKMLTVLRLK